jgi:hypothetical protein
VFCRFGHLAVLVIDKYRNDEKTFPRDVKFCPRTGYISCGFIWPGPPHQLLPIREPAKDKWWYDVGGFPIRVTKFYVAGKNILAVTVQVLVNDLKMHKAEKLTLFKFKNWKRKFKNLRYPSGWLESSYEYSRIVKTSFYCMRLSL